MDFSHVTTWIFDLDNTLYAPEQGLFAQIEARMNLFLQRLLGVDAAEADRLRALYWRDHGTTLAGLMARHGVDPHGFLDEVHDVDMSGLLPDPALAEAMSALPGRRIIHTNADMAYAKRVLARLGLPRFDAIYGIAETGFRPKPDPRAFAAVIAADGFDPASAAMFEDDPRNLLEPHRLGMQTILVGPGRIGPDGFDGPAAHLSHRTASLARFLRGLV